MPIAFDLESYRKKFNCSVYFETGLLDPRQEVSSTLALKCNFDKLFCIEIRSDYVELGKIVFRDEIVKGRYNLINDDSINIGKYLDADLFTKNRGMFFLDAHNDYTGMNYKFKCPLYEELTAIGNLPRKDHIILIDDLRILNGVHPWGETSYGNVNFLDMVIDKILKINPKYKFTTLD